MNRNNENVKNGQKWEFCKTNLTIKTNKKINLENDN